MDKEMLLEKFIQSKLTEGEQKEFDRLYLADESFKTEVDFYSNISRVAEAEDDDAFREMLSSFEAEAILSSEQDHMDRDVSSDFEPKVESKKITVRRRPTRWLVAASIVFVAVLTYVFIVDDSTSTKELFAQNFEPYPNVVHPIVRGEDIQDQKTNSFIAYQDSKYATAADLFSQLYNKTEEPYYLFYQANALIQLNRGREAIPLLKNHLKTEDKLTEKSTWYLAMAYLQDDDTENAKKILQTVVGDGGFKMEEAKILLKSL